MSVAIADIQFFAVEILNASQPTSSYGTISSEKYKAGEFDFAIRLADLAIAKQYALDEGRRASFLTTATVAHAGQLPSRIGSIDSIFFTVTGGPYAGARGPKFLPVSELSYLEDQNRNPQSNPYIKPFVILENNTLFHTGGGMVAGGASGVTVTVRYATVSYSSGGTNIQSPDESARAVACAALAILVTKDGQRVSAGSLYENMYHGEMKGLGFAQPTPTGEMA